MRQQAGIGHWQEKIHRFFSESEKGQNGRRGRRKEADEKEIYTRNGRKTEVSKKHTDNP